MSIRFRASLALAAMLIGGSIAMADPLLLGVVKATVTANHMGGPALSLLLTEESRDAFAAFTTANVGRIVDLSIDGKVVMSPRVVEPILGGEIMVGGDLGTADLEPIAEKIASGKATVAVDVEAE